MDEVSTPPDALPPSRQLPIAAIHIPDRLRKVDEAWAQALAASFEDHGMDTPITVRPHKGGGAGTEYSLVAGAHRLAAATALGWIDIKAVVRHLDDDQARIVEIDENLLRRELDPLDRGQFLRERKAVYERMHPTSRHGAAPKPKSDDEKSPTWRLLPARFTREVSDATGFSERSVQRDLQIADALDPGTVTIIRGTPHARKQLSLIKLARETNPAKQRALAMAMRDGAKTFEAAKVVAGFEPAPAEDRQMTYLAQLHAAWGKADQGTRAAFMADIDAAYVGSSSLAKPAKGGRK